MESCTETVEPVSLANWIQDELHETGIWQRNHYDRIIRKDRESNAIGNYIEANPRNWVEEDGILIAEK